MPEKNKFLHTKTNKGEKKTLNEVSTTLPILNFQSALKNEKIKNTISNFELQKELSKKSKNIGGNEFQHINIINDSQHFFGNNSHKIEKKNNLTSINDNQFDCSNEFSFLNKRENIFFDKNNNELKDQKSFKKINCNSDISVAQKWGKDNKFMNNFYQENLDFSFGYDMSKLPQQKQENESILIFKGQNSSFQSNNRNIFFNSSNNISNNNLNEYQMGFPIDSNNICTSDFFPKDDKSELNKSILNNLYEPNCFNFSKELGNNSEEELNNKIYNLTPPSRKLSPNDINQIKEKNSFQDKNKKKSYFSTFDLEGILNICNNTKIVILTQKQDQSINIEMDHLRRVKNIINL